MRTRRSCASREHIRRLNPRGGDGSCLLLEFHVTTSWYFESEGAPWRPFVAQNRHPSRTVHQTVREKFFADSDGGPDLFSVGTHPRQMRRLNEEETVLALMPRMAQVWARKAEW